MSEIRVNTISEKTSASGVTIDGLTIKDGNIIGDVALAGTTPTFTIGDAGAEDASLIFDGNAQDFYIALDDSADDLVIGTGSTVGSNVKMVIENGGNVGINTSSPASNLHIKTSVDNSLSQGLVIERSANSDAGYINYNGGAFQIRSTVGDPIVFGETDSEHVRIVPDGKVGIGTSSPHSEMHIVADNVSETWSAYDGTALTVENNDTDGCIIQNIARNSATGEIWFGDDDGRNLGRIRYEHNGNALEFWTNGGEKLHINSSGQVGIGTDAPDKELHVQASDGSAEIRLENSAHTVRMDLQALTTTCGIRTVHSHPLFFSTNQVERMRIDSSGNVGIGTSSPSAALHVDASGGGVIRVSRNSSSTANFMALESDGTNGTVKAVQSLIISAGGGEVARFTSGGLAIGGTGAANTLDDYEEGTWTPVLKSGTNTVSYSGTFLANYVKIGRMVHYSLSYRGGTFSGDVTGANTEIQGLPFASSSTAGNRQPSTQINYYVGIKFDDENVLGLVGEGSSIIEVVGHDGATSGYGAVGIHSVGSNAYLQVSGIYYV